MNSGNKIINIYVSAHSHQAKAEKIKEGAKKSKNNRQTSNTVLAFTSAWCEWSLIIWRKWINSSVLQFLLCL